MFTKIQLTHWNISKLLLTGFFFVHIISCLVRCVDSLDQLNRSVLSFDTNFFQIYFERFNLCWKRNRKIEPFTATLAPELIRIVGRKKCLKKFLSLFVGGSVGIDALAKQTMIVARYAHRVFSRYNNGIQRVHGIRQRLQCFVNLFVHGDWCTEQR